MARDVTVTIAGTRELGKLLESIPKKEAADAIRKGTRAGQKVIARVAARRAPRKTGVMARAIKVRAFKRRRHRFGHVTVLGEVTLKKKGKKSTKKEKTTSKTKKGGEVPFYSTFQEFGWHRGKTFIEGSHFMENAVKDKGRTAGIIAAAIIRSELGINLRTSSLVKKALGVRRSRTTGRFI